MSVVFLAVGNDTDTPPPSSLNGAPLLNRKNLTSPIVLSDDWDRGRPLLRASCLRYGRLRASGRRRATRGPRSSRSCRRSIRRGKPAGRTTRPGKKAALVTDGGVLGSPFDATRKPLSSSNDQALFHVPVDLCSSDKCGRWTMSVYGRSRPRRAWRRSSRRLMMRCGTPSTTRSSPRPCHLADAQTPSTQVQSASDTTRAGGARPAHGAARGPRGLGLVETDGRARRFEESRRCRGRCSTSRTGRCVRWRERRVECGKAPGRRRARRHDARIRGRLRREPRPYGPRATRVLITRYYKRTGGPASNLAVAQHSPDPPRGRHPTPHHPARHALSCCEISAEIEWEPSWGLEGVLFKHC